MDVNEYLNTVWFGNTIRTWLIAAAILSAAVGALIAIKALLVGRFFRFAARTSNEIDAICRKPYGVYERALRELSHLIQGPIVPRREQAPGVVARGTVLDGVRPYPPSKYPNAVAFT